MRGRRRAARRDTGPAAGEVDLSAGAVWIDAPLDGCEHPHRAVTLRGWAFFGDAPLDRVEVLIDGRPAGRARLGLPRSDVADHLNDQCAVTAGWEFVVRPSALPAAGGPLVLEVRCLRGADTLGSARIGVVIAAPQAPDADDEARLTVLRSRFRPGAGAVRGERLRLAVFTHHLGLGGAQLYLYELLRRLRDELAFDAVVCAPDDGALRPRLEALGIEVSIAPGPPVASAELYEGSLARLGAWLSDWGPDAVLVNSLLAFAGADCGVRLGLPVLWAIHESLTVDAFWPAAYPNQIVDPHIDRCTRAAALGSAALVFESDATRALFADVTRDGDHAVTVPYGIDLAELDAARERADRGAIRERLGLPPDARVLLCMATIEPRKSQTMLAQAFAQVAGDHPDAFLAFVGDQGGLYRDAFLDLVAAGGAQERISVTGVTDEIYDWYEACDVLVSASDLESMPRSALEAMAFERPFMAASVFGVPELIADGETGFLFEPRDVGALQRALTRALTLGDDELRAVGRRARERVVAEHDSSGYARFYAGRLVALTGVPV